jgi:hypothetical protein
VIFANGAADGAAKLILLEGSPLAIVKVVSRVKVGIAQKLEDVAMELVRAALGDHIDLAAGKVAILGVEVAGQDTKLRERVEVGNDCCSAEAVLFDRKAVEQKAIGRFAHAVDGLVAWILFSGDGRDAEAGALEVERGRRVANHDGCSAGHAGLQIEEVSITAAVERHSDHLLLFNDLA